MKAKAITMFKSVLFIVLLSHFQLALSQVPQKMSYQAVVRNNANALVSNGSIGIRISILQGSANGLSVYTETQTTSTNTNGLISIIIGNGTVISGVLSSVNWATGNYYIKSEVDPNGGSNYTIEGSSQLLSVPYALYSANGPPGPTGTFPQGTNIGDMQYWNGTSWTMIPIGNPGQYLQVSSSNIPQWTGNSFLTINTLPVTGILQFGAVSGVNVSSDGGSPLTQKGICYDTSPSPTIYSPKVPSPLVVGSQVRGMGYFFLVNANNISSNNASLLPNTTYYVRAYAENSAGLVYGNELTFTTLSDGLPNVTTNPVTEVLAYSATLSGSALYETPIGPSAKGFCYSQTPNPTLSNTVINMGSGNDAALTYNLTGLTSSTTYYVRAFATNANGTQYGAEQIFTTCVTPSFTIGQTYQGGKIFYIDCTGQHGLVAANPNAGLILWGCPGYNIDGTSTEIYTGQSNTNAIVSGCTSTVTAASYCDNLTFNGYSDWFLPSSKELLLVKAYNITFTGLYGCWSSSQFDVQSSYSVNIGPGNANLYNTPKGYAINVLAVRAF